MTNGYQVMGFCAAIIASVLASTERLSPSFQPRSARLCSFFEFVRQSLKRSLLQPLLQASRHANLDASSKRACYSRVLE